MAKPSSFPIEKDYFDGARRVTRESELIAADPTKPHLADLLNQIVDFFESGDAGLAADIATNAAAIAANAADILTNSGDIATNTADIATNAVDILTAAGLGAGVILRISSGGKTTHASISDALSGASVGDVVLVGSGTYSESITVPDGVCLMGLYGPIHTLINGAAATGDRVDLGDGSTLWGFSVDMPTDSAAAVRYSGSDFAIVRDVGIIGNGSAGVGIWVDGSGRLECVDVRLLSGDSENFLRTDSGETRVKSSYPIAVGGSNVNRFFNILGGDVAFNNLVFEASSINHCLHVGAATVVGEGCSIVNATIGLHVIDENAIVEIRGIRMSDSVVTHVKIDDGLASSPRVHLTAAELDRNKVTHDPSYTDVLLFYQDDFSVDRGFFFDGGLSVGRAEGGSEVNFGEGDSYVRQLAIISSDNTATSTTEGGNLTDLSSAAGSPSGSTFSFQGTGAGHTIMIGSKLSNNVDKLKHWGIHFLQTTAAVEIVKRSFAFEIWDGAAWVAIGTMAVSVDEAYRYANEHFLRADSHEIVRYGISASTTWVKKAIGGQTLYWSRIRITDDLTTAPVFEQFKLVTSNANFTHQGILNYLGLSRFRLAITSGGGTFGESGGVANVNIAVGSGGVPTGFNFQAPDSFLNGDGDAVYKAIEIPEGTCTSCPLYIESQTVPDAVESAAQLIVSVLPVEAAGVLEADPSGGRTPVARTVANSETLTAKAAQTSTKVVDYSATGKIYRTQFGPFDISSYYEGDILLVRFELDDDGTNLVNVNLLTLAINGVKWTPGARL